MSDLMTKMKRYDDLLIKAQLQPEGSSLLPTLISNLLKENKSINEARLNQELDERIKNLKNAIANGKAA